MIKNLSLNFRAMVFVLFGFMGFNIADAFVKEASNHYHFANAALYPMVAFCVLVVLFSKKLGGLKSTVTSKNKKLHLMRAISGTTGYVCFIYAIQTITLAQAYTLVLTAPFWIAVLSVFFFKEYIGWHRWLSIIVGFIGVLLVLRPGLTPLDTPSIMILFGAACVALYIILTKKIGDKEPLINLILFPILMDIVFFTIILFYTNAWSLPQVEHLYLFGMAGIFYFIAMILSSLGYASGESSALAPIQYSQILWGALIGYFFFAETPEMWTFIGASIIIGSGIYLIHREHLHEKEK